MTHPVETPMEWDMESLLCVKDVARILNVCVRTVQRRCHDGQLEYVKVKRAVRIRWSALMKYIENNIHHGVR